MTVDRNSLLDLRIIDIKAYGDIDVSALTEITPEDLASNRGVAIASLFDTSVFVDRTLGYAVVHKKFVHTIQIVRVKSLGDEETSEPQVIEPYDNWAARVLTKRQGTKPLATPPQVPWYVDQDKGWPKQRGGDTYVALLDSGIAPGHARLPRQAFDHDFCACELPSADTSDSSAIYHGTRCAGAIGAKDVQGVRTSPAPDATIIAARVHRYDNELYISLVDILLMLSWIVQNGWTPAIVNMSFILDNVQVEKHKRDLLDEIVKRLRDNNLALIFASTLRYNDHNLTYPGKLAGIIAVGEYRCMEDHGKLYIELPLGCDPRPWLEKTELLFGPGNDVQTVPINQLTSATYGEVSASCAYASGVAALYLQHYRSTGGKILEKVAREMMRRGIPLPDPKIQHTWKAVGIDPLGSPTHNPALRIVVPCNPGP